MDRKSILLREKIKYNQLHKDEPKYGGRSGRAKQFFKNNDEFHQKVKSILATSKTLLDVGCGKGFFMDVFHKNFPQLAIVGLDIAEEAKNARPDLNIVIAHAGEMPFKDAKFDIVIHQDGMEHIPEELEEEVLKEFVRVSKKWIYLTIATHAVKHHDDFYDKLGLGAVHINLKTKDAWEKRLAIFCAENRVKITGFEDYEYWVHVLMEKI